MVYSVTVNAFTQLLDYNSSRNCW